MDADTTRKIEEIRNELQSIFARHPVERAGLFGSTVRGEDNESSDIDILVEITKDDSFDLFDFIEIKQDIEDKLKRKADLVEYTNVKDGYKKYIFPEEVRIYEKNQ